MTTSIEFKKPKATLLIQEYLNNEDLDFNNKIYGYDFQIKQDDDIPEILKEFQPKFKNKLLLEMNWKDYLQEIKHERNS
ncbi:MAG: hypothetical protein ACOC2W_00470 [bacterium]